VPNNLTNSLDDAKSLPVRFSSPEVVPMSSDELAEDAPRFLGPVKPQAVEGSKPMSKEKSTTTSVKTDAKEPVDQSQANQSTVDMSSEISPASSLNNRPTQEPASSSKQEEPASSEQMQKK